MGSPNVTTIKAIAILFYVRACTSQKHWNPIVFMEDPLTLTEIIITPTPVELLPLPVGYHT